MNFGSYWVVLVRGWIIILISFLAGVGAAALGTSLTTPMYRSTTVLFVSSAANPGDLGSLYQGGLFTQQQIFSYAEIIASPAILKPTIEGLRLDVSQDGLENRITVITPPETSLISVSVDDPSPSEAQRIANEIGRQASEVLPSLETVGEKGTPTVKVSVIREGSLPAAPSTPKTGLNLVLGGMLGLIVGVLIVLIRHITDRTVRTSAQLETITHAAVLSEIPASVWKPNLQIFSTTDEIFSAGHESFYRLRLNLQAVHGADQTTSIVVTSAEAGDGKSMTAVNLAMALAETRGTVVLVDADLRRPTVARLLKLDDPPGLSEVLRGDSPLDEVLLRRENGRLSVLPAGTIPGNPNEMISSDWLAAVIDDLKRRYDFVVIDAPPLLPVSDAAALSCLTDGALVVARYGKTNTARLGEAIASLRTVGASVIGAVLTFTPDQRLSPYAFHGPPADVEDTGKDHISSDAPAPVGELNYVLRGYGSAGKGAAAPDNILPDPRILIEDIQLDPAPPPSKEPSGDPGRVPSGDPGRVPSGDPGRVPSGDPSKDPSKDPSDDSPKRAPRPTS